MKSRGIALVLLGMLWGCTPPDPLKELEVTDFDAYWVIDPNLGSEHYMAPAVKLHVRNKGGTPQRSLQATASFRHKGETAETWGSDWQQISSAGKPLAPGQGIDVQLKSDARYHSNGSPEGMFTHHDFKDARVEVYLRLGASPWIKFGEVDVERRLGAKSVQPSPAPEK